MFKKGDLVVRIEDDPQFPNFKRGMIAIVWDLHPYSNIFRCRYLGKRYTGTTFHGERCCDFRLATKLERVLYERNTSDSTD